MNPCPQCGATPQASDKFCNICGTPIVQPAFGAPPGGGFQPAPAAAGFGAPPPHAAYGAPGPGAGAPMRCQMGHDVAPGASYCAHGHPIAVEAMPFANDQYGGGYGQQPGFGGAPPPPAAYGGQPPYGQPGGFPDPNAQYGGYGQPQGFGGAPPPGFGPAAGPGGYGGPPPGAGGFADPYAQQPPPAGPGFGAPPAGPGFGADPYAQQHGQPPGPGGYGGPAPAGAPAAAAPPPNLPPNAVRGFLVSYQSNTQGDFWPLGGGRKTVGRANSGEQVDIPLSDATISSRHAAFVVDAIVGTIQIEDTGSTNGTFVNEEHVGFNGKRELRDGDKVRFGGFTTIVKIVTRL